MLHVPPYWFHHVESTTPSGTPQFIVFSFLRVQATGISCSRDRCPRTASVSLASWSEFSAHQPMHELFTVHYETLTWRHYHGKDQIIAVKLYIGAARRCPFLSMRFSSELTAHARRDAREAGVGLTSAALRGGGSAQQVARTDAKPRPCTPQRHDVCVCILCVLCVDKSYRSTGIGDDQL